MPTHQDERCSAPCPHMLHRDVVVLYQNSWAWLQLNLQGNVTTMPMFESVGTLDGGGVRRKLVVLHTFADLSSATNYMELLAIQRRQR